MTDRRGWVVIVLVVLAVSVAGPTLAQDTTTTAESPDDDQGDGLPSWTVFVAAIAGFGFLVLFRRYFGRDEF